MIADAPITWSAQVLRAKSESEHQLSNVIMVVGKVKYGDAVLDSDHLVLGSFCGFGFGD